MLLPALTLLPHLMMLLTAPAPTLRCGGRSYGTPGRLPESMGLVRKPFDDTKLYTANGFPTKVRPGRPGCRLRSQQSPAGSCMSVPPALGMAPRPPL
jgi:hypothetical protein